MQKLTVIKKIQILQDNFNRCLKNHLCGDWLSVQIGEDIHEYHWEIIAKKYNYFLICYTDDRIIKLKYDFDFDFDSNFEAFLETIYETIYNDMF